VRYFNTAGPCNPALHYMVPPESRLPDARRLVDRGQYFVLHAPRQTGKTTTLAALAAALTSEGRHAALHFSCETAEVAGDDYGLAELQVLSSIRAMAGIRDLPPELLPPSPWPDGVPGRRIFSALEAWARRCPLPLALFFDEIGALRGQSLRSVLRQLRDGYQHRPAAFPASIVLSGVRDVRDYTAASGDNPFNISVRSLRIGDFTFDEVAELYRQHTAETGQAFTPQAAERAFEYTQGQPWLTNALAREVINGMGVEAPAAITAEHVDEAKERLVLARATHLDSVADKLSEPRVRRVVEPLIAGGLPEADAAYNADVRYVQDLGLVAPGQPIRIANPIYREVIVRVLGARTETGAATSTASTGSVAVGCAVGRVE
jgi:hypothetical protein